MASTGAGPSGALGTTTNSTGSIDFCELADRCKTLGIEAQFNPSIAEKAALIESANQTRAWKRNERKKLAQRIRDAIRNAEDALNDADAAAVNDLEPLVPQPPVSQPSEPFPLNDPEPPVPQQPPVPQPLSQAEAAEEARIGSAEAAVRAYHGDRLPVSPLGYCGRAAGRPARHSLAAGLRFAARNLRPCRAAVRGVGRARDLILLRRCG